MAMYAILRVSSVVVTCSRKRHSFMNRYFGDVQPVGLRCTYEGLFNLLYILCSGLNESASAACWCYLSSIAALVSMGVVETLQAQERTRACGKLQDTGSCKTVQGLEECVQCTQLRSLCTIFALV